LAAVHGLSKNPLGGQVGSPGWAKPQGGAACLSNSERSPERGRRGAAAARFAIEQTVTAEQARIVQLLGGVDVQEDALEVRIRAEGLVSLVGELRRRNSAIMLLAQPGAGKSNLP
jgi:hypothetical protein